MSSSKPPSSSCTMAPTTTKTDMDRLFRMTLASERKAIDSISENPDNMSKDSTHRLRTTVTDQLLLMTPFDVPILTTGPKRNPRLTAAPHKPSNSFKLAKRYGGIYSIPEERSVCQADGVLLHSMSNRSVSKNNSNVWNPPRPVPTRAPMSHREDTIKSKLMLPQQRKRANTTTTTTSFLDGTSSSLTTGNHSTMNSTSRTSKHKREANQAIDSDHFESILELLAAATDNDQNTPEGTVRKTVTLSVKAHEDQPVSAASRSATRSKAQGDQTGRTNKRDRNRAMDAEAFTSILGRIHPC